MGEVCQLQMNEDTYTCKVILDDYLPFIYDLLADYILVNIKENMQEDFLNDNEENTEGIEVGIHEEQDCFEFFEITKEDERYVFTKSIKVVKKYNNGHILTSKELKCVIQKCFDEIVVGLEFPEHIKLKHRSKKDFVIRCYSLD